MAGWRDVEGGRSQVKGGRDAGCREMKGLAASKRTLMVGEQTVDSPPPVVGRRGPRERVCRQAQGCDAV